MRHGCWLVCRRSQREVLWHQIGFSVVMGDALEFASNTSVPDCHQFFLVLRNRNGKTPYDPFSIAFRSLDCLTAKYKPIPEAS